jgi:uncharacterized protein involved in outer membrane biogenesis
MKYLKWIVLGVVLVIVIGVVAVFMTIDGIVRRSVETHATNSLDLQTTLRSADLSLLGGSLALKDLEVASPNGFSAPRMFTLGGAKLGVSYSQLRTDPIGVNEITIDQPQLVVEQANGKLNFQVLMDKQPKTPPDSGKPGDGKRDEGEPIRLIIHDLAVNDAKVVLRPGIPGLAQEINVTIPSFHLQDIGRGEGNQNGAAIKEVVMLVVTTLAQKASESEGVPPDVKLLLSMNADQVKARLAGELKKDLGKVTKDLGKNLPPEANKAIEKGIGDLLGGDKKKEEKKK